MDKKLGETLIQRKIVKEDTEIEAWYKANEFGGGYFDQLGMFTINKIDQNTQGEVCFHARSNIDGKWHDFGYNDIVKIDGMEPSKLANAYGIKPGKVNTKVKKK